MLILPILIIVGISISTALILEYVENLHTGMLSFYVIVGMVVVLGLNVLKFIVWNFLHKRYDLSSTYPLTAIYFPMIYAISVFKGEITVDFMSLTAISFIFIGVYLIFSSNSKKSLA